MVKLTTAYDPSTRMHHRRATADVEPILQSAADIRGNERNGFSKERTFRKIGEIPMIVLNDALKEGFNLLDGSPESEKWIRNWLQQNPKFMTVDALLTQKGKRHIIR